LNGRQPFLSIASSVILTLGCFIPPETRTFAIDGRPLCTAISIPSPRINPSHITPIKTYFPLPWLIALNYTGVYKRCGTSSMSRITTTRVLSALISLIRTLVKRQLYSITSKLLYLTKLKKRLTIND
jgi:hypothetical protein